MPYIHCSKKIKRDILSQCGHLTSICLQSQMLQAALLLQLFHSLGFPWTTFGTSYQNRCYITASISEGFFLTTTIHLYSTMLAHHWKCKRASLVWFVCSWVLEKHGSATQSINRREPVPFLERKDSFWGKSNTVILILRWLQTNKKLTEY